MTQPMQNYGGKIRSSLAWMGSAQLFGQLITWASTIFVIRLLDPGDYGVMAMATVFLSFLLMLSDLGIGAAIVQAENLSEDDTRYIQGFVVLFNFTGFAVMLFGSVLVASFFGEPRLTPILRVLSSCFLLMTLYVVPQALIQREMQFDLKAKIDFAMLTIGAAVSLGCALLGLGVWALVAGAISTHLIRAIGCNIVRPGALRPRVSFNRASRFLQFGGIIVVSRLLWFLYTNLDVAIAGKLLGKDLLGFYSVALTLSWIPLAKVMPTLTQVLFSSYSRIQRDRTQVQDNLKRSMRYAFAIFAPVFWGMALVAPDGIPIALGEDWEPVVRPLQLICIVLPLRAIAVLLPPALSGVGHPLVNAINMAITLPIMAIAFYTGAHYGLTGIASAWPLAYPIAFAAIIARSLPVLGVTALGLWQSVRASLLAAMVMAGVVASLQLAIADLPALGRLSAAVICGMLTYFGAMWWLDRRTLIELRATLAH